MSLGFTEILFLSLILLLFFGPARLPQIGKSLGEAIRDLKKSLNGTEIDVTEESRKPKKRDEEPKA
ncbi:MAG TPA: twin-arginine translocase TatA/TatE family subunit [Bdellovibrionales bacterium]|nr:twin-arginine translocase TatA/TatE family subunit [Bdellovibrionales bacterium]